ncbi:MAG: endopeptidase La [Desulfocapsaceae bacterium]|nr:endopeptidase La [Desulfocapsaceae bacterium]
MAEEATIIPPENSDGSGENTQNTESRSLIVARDNPPGRLMIFPLHDRPMFPKMMGPVIIDDKNYQKVIVEDGEQSQPMYFGLLLVKPTDDNLQHRPTDQDDFFSMGVVVRVQSMSPAQKGEPLQIVVQALERFVVKKIVFKDRVPYADVEYFRDHRIEVTEEIKAYSVAIVDCIKELVTLNPLFKEGLSLIIERINVSDPSALADFAASMTTSSGPELQQILETIDVRERIEKVLVLLKNELEVSKLKAQISKRIEEQLSKQQREFFLKQQLQEIKKELGLAKDDTQAEVEKFEKRLKNLTLSDEAADRVKEEIDKLKLIGPSSAEFNVTRAYLDWLTILPWGVYTNDNYDIAKAANILHKEHHGLDDVKDRILELISVGIIKGDLSGSIILLVGPPGVGKTSIGQSIAKALGREYYRFSVGGMRDEAEIKGHRRTYIGALPGKFLQAIKTCKTANPLIMLDEVDKIGASFQGDPASALLEVLDPEQNQNFLDHYLDVRFDLSKVLFICTANQLESIPQPLVDRMEVIRLPGYIKEEKVEIATKHLIPRQRKMHGLTAKQIVIPKSVIRAIIDGYAREAGVRYLENCIKKILRKSAKEIVDKPETKVRIKTQDLQDLLGKKHFTEDQAFKKPRVGVIKGLAYTSMGGTTLYVESIPLPAKQPGYKQTGQLGKVMVESAEIAYSYIRSLLRNNKKAVEFFANNFIHLHVPAGATPKDGPSAGITMACSLYSLAINKPIIASTAMTGELTLSGLVMPIGGVKEKIIAAKRAKVKQVILPNENKDDFELLPKHIQDGITPHFVTTFNDVKKICFPN